MGTVTNREIWAEKYPLWNDWHWQMRERVTDAEGLARWLPLSDAQRAEIEACTGRFRMAVTPYWLSLIDPEDPADPIRRQCVVSAEELRRDPNDLADPLSEDAYCVTPHIVHRYPDRVLLLVTMECAMYCRHCTRRRMVGETEETIPLAELDRELDYIRAHKEVRDVLISGGDPLTLPAERLEKILAMVRAIPHVEIIRIGTRVPCVLPMRVDDELVSMLKRFHPLWVNVQFNHARELTPEAAGALGRLADAGIPMNNQSVLLRGVNDTAEDMRDLALGLVRNRVRPYYLYQCDLSEGISHFRTETSKGVEIVHALQGQITGFAVPKYVIDAPGGGGKVPVQYDYVRKRTEEEIVFENYEGKEYRYPEPGRGGKDNV